MNRTIQHRGPDDEGYYFDDESFVHLAMRRLSIIDLTSGKQPIFNEDRSIVLVFNGEIYNYRILRKSLIEKGHRFKTNSDTETIIHGYEEFGEAVVEHLHGMFAFALWDINTKTLFCARDRLGIKPFYYCREGGRFFFASEQKSIIRVLDRQLSVNLRALMQHVMIGFCTTQSSLLETIEQLPPGCVLAYNGGCLTVRRYWELSLAPSAPRYGEDEAVELLSEHINRSVEEHLVSDVPVALTLSGGLDSSILALAMGKAMHGHGEKIHAYTIGYGNKNDELPFARLLAKRLSDVPVSFHERIVNPEEAIQDIPQIIWHLEEPLSNITAITAYQWAKFLSEKHKVTLVGEGADEVFGGYLYYRLFSGALRMIPRKMQVPLYRFMFLQPSLSLISDLFGGNKKIIDELRHVYHNDLFKIINKETEPFRGILRFDMELELSNNQLLRIDKLTMAHSLEARVPYLDHRLVELAWSWPEKWKIKATEQKYILKKAFQNKLPAEIIKRPKTGKGGSQPIFPIMFSSGLEKKIITAIIAREQVLKEYFNMSVIQNLIQKKSGIYPISGSRIRDKLLYFLYLFLIWHDLFIENRGREYSLFY